MSNDLCLDPGLECHPPQPVILVLDHHADSRNGLAELARRRGCRVFAAASPDELAEWPAEEYLPASGVFFSASFPGMENIESRQEILDLFPLTPMVQVGPTAPQDPAHRPLLMQTVDPRDEQSMDAALESCLRFTDNFREILDRNLFLNQTRYLEEPLARILHDLNNQITGLKGGADLISFALASLPESESKTKIERYLKQFILPGVEGVENLIRKWRHLRDGRLHTPVPTDLARLVLRAVALVADPCQQRHVTIRVCGQLCGEKVKSYPGEENGLKGMVNAEQIVIGLSYVIRNALEAVQEQKEGRVQIDLDQESPGTHVILIDDNGAGIPEENRELVWRSFFSTKGQDRNGLGLPLAKQVIEKCQSQIECAPSPLGGTAFRILVPACPSKAV